MDAMLNRWKIAKELLRHAIARHLLVSQIEISPILHQLRQQDSLCLQIELLRKMAPRYSSPLWPELMAELPSTRFKLLLSSGPNVLKWKCLWLTSILLCFIRHVRLCFFPSILILFEQRQNKGHSMNVNDTISEEKLIAILALRIKHWKRSHSTQQGWSNLIWEFFVSWWILKAEDINSLLHILEAMYMNRLSVIYGNLI